MSINNHDPAFPIPDYDRDRVVGMSILTYISTEIAKGLVTKSQPFNDNERYDVADRAILMAKELIQQLDEEE